MLSHDPSAPPFPLPFLPVTFFIISVAPPFLHHILVLLLHSLPPHCQHRFSSPSMQEKRVCAEHMVLAMWKVHTYMCVCV